MKQYPHKLANTQYSTYKKEGDNKRLKVYEMYKKYKQEK